MNNKISNKKYMYINKYIARLCLKNIVFSDYKVKFIQTVQLF